MEVPPRCEPLESPPKILCNRGAVFQINIDSRVRSSSSPRAHGPVSAEGSLTQLLFPFYSGPRLGVSGLVLTYGQLLRAACLFGRGV